MQCGEEEVVDGSEDLTVNLSDRLDIISSLGNEEDGDAPLICPNL